MNRFLSTIILALASLSAWPQTAPISGSVINQYGQPVAGANVLICSVTSTGTPCTPPAAIFSDFNLTQPTGNPTQTDVNGNFTVYVGALPFPNLYTVQAFPVPANISGTPYTWVVPGPWCSLSGCTISGPLTLTGALNSTYTGTDNFAGPLSWTGGPSGTPASTTLLNLGGLSTVLTTAQNLSGPLGGPEIGQVFYAGTTQYPLPSAAYAAAVAAGAGIVDIPCGTYADTINITTSNITFRGHGIQCTTLNPIGNNPVFTLAAGSSGGGINYDTVENMSISNTSSTSDGIQFTGGINVPNDRHLFRNIAVIGFRYNVNVLGRLIWTKFENSYFLNATTTNFQASTAGVNNFIQFLNDSFNGAQNFGVYWNNTNSSGTSQGISFDHVNVEYNGASGTLANCAGLSLTGIGSGHIDGGSYFEGNCLTNPDTLGADVRETGTYAQAFSIRDSLLWSLTDYDILNDATQTTGKYEGNNLTGASVNRIKIATTHPLSAMEVGCNFLNGGNVNIVPDFNNDTHTFSTCPQGTDETFISSVTSNTINVGLSSLVYLNGGPFTINTITGGFAGHTLIIYASSGGQILTNSTNPNGISLADTHNRTLAAGFSTVLTFDAVAGYWRELYTEPTDLNIGNLGASGTVTAFTVDATNGLQVNTAAPAGHTLCGNGSVYVDSAGNCQTTAISASLTTTSATSDNVTITGMNSSGHCSLAPTNASAATNIATTYISAKTTNQVTVTHAATASMTMDLLCTPY